MRDDDGRRFPWGNEPPTPERTAFGRPLGTAPGHGTTDDVGAHPTGKGPYGHDDLAGNVWEWMEDEYDPFAYSRATASVGRPGTCAQIMAAEEKLRAEGKQGFTGSNPSRAAATASSGAAPSTTTDPASAPPTASTTPGRSTS